MGTHTSTHSISGARFPKLDRILCLYVFTQEQWNIWLDCEDVFVRLLQTYKVVGLQARSPTRCFHKIDEPLSLMCSNLNVIN